MDVYTTAFELIDLRSFSNLWFWIMLAVFWSTASHYALGVPFDMVGRAAKHGGQAEQDLHDLVRINTNRLIYIVDEAGSWLVMFAFFFLSVLITLGFVYWIEFCQALTLIFAPMLLVFALSVRTARRIQDRRGEELRKSMRFHRVVVQTIGLFSILVSSMWGMFINLTTGVL